MADAAPRTPTFALERSNRLRTPDAPLHGARFDDNGPLSPRRSRRATRNPYSTKTTRNGAITTPPQSSPPSPASSPSEHRTPEKRLKNRLAPRVDRGGALMTPAKTPQQHLTPPPSRVRRLNFQVADPSHAMPTPRKMKKHSRSGVYEAYGRVSSIEEVEVYSDFNARVPTRDDTMDNPFLGPPTPATAIRQRQRSTKPRPLTSNMSKEEMQQRVENDEGLIFTFRGKQVFRPYRDIVDDLTETEKLGYTIIDRSNDRPRRLSFGRRPEINNDVDEEALTDIEVDADEDVTPVSSQTRTITHNKSPFDQWQRTKSGSRKRELEEASTAATKKAKSDL